jgi:hypothetical protein
VINYAVANYSVDPDRIYLTGLSMGGGATWEFASASVANATRLAAILPVCGAMSPDATRAKNMADAGLAVWATHNQDDGIVTVQNTIGWTDRINSNMPKIMAKRTIWPSGGHNSWGATYDPFFKVDGVYNVYEWMLTNKRGVVPPVSVLPPAAFTPIKLAAASVAGWTRDKGTFSQTTGIAGIKAVDIWGFNPNITGTSVPALYQVENFGDMAYRIPVPHGDYTVTLHFAELYWNAAAKRIFHVDAEGSRTITNLDVWTAAGGRFKALQRSFDVKVTDGTLNINFVRGAADFPKVSAIEVNQVGTIVIPDIFKVVTVNYLDSVTGAVLLSRTDTFKTNVVVTTVIK